jgi:hypothetical protein
VNLNQSATQHIEEEKKKNHKTRFYPGNPNGKTNIQLASARILLFSNGMITGSLVQLGASQ